jgi:antitoxin (DNA-binding transcriptional repressor) of toxin-antitoxin stability system
MSEPVLFTMDEARSRLSLLTKRVWAGDKVVITKDGKPYLDLLPHVGVMRRRKPRRLKGQIRMSADFDRALRDFIE